VHFIENKWVSITITFSVIVLPTLVKAFRDFVLHRGDANRVSREP
jgi:hypothetical protein